MLKATALSKWAMHRIGEDEMISPFCMLAEQCMASGNAAMQKESCHFLMLSVADQLLWLHDGHSMEKGEQTSAPNIPMSECMT